MSNNIIVDTDKNKAIQLFKQKIFDRYAKCVISGAHVKRCEVCYITPHTEGAKEDVNNGLLIDAGLCKLFTNHLLSINPTTLCAVVNSDIIKEDSDIAKYNGIKTNINSKSLKYLQKHNDKFMEKDKHNINKDTKKVEPLEKTNDDIQKKMGRPDKDIYEKERKIILEKLLSILKISDTNKVFFCEDMSSEQKTDILNLIPDVKKYFKCGKWSMFTKEIDQEYKFFSLTKSILKAMNKKAKYINVKNNKTQIVEKKGLAFV